MDFGTTNGRVGPCGLVSNVIWLVQNKSIGHPLSNEYACKNFLLTGKGGEFFKDFLSGLACSHFFTFHRKTSDANCVNQKNIFLNLSRVATIGNFRAGKKPNVEWDPMH